jgi:hypothetical protein
LACLNQVLPSLTSFAVIRKKNFVRVVTYFKSAKKDGTSTSMYSKYFAVRRRFPLIITHIMTLHMYVFISYAQTLHIPYIVLGDKCIHTYLFAQVICGGNPGKVVRMSNLIKDTVRIHNTFVTFQLNLNNYKSNWTIILKVWENILIVNVLICSELKYFISKYEI